jgi:hypothetical protein
VSDDLGTNFSMLHDLRSTIFLLNKIFKSAEIKTTKENKRKFAIDLAETKLMKHAHET